MRIRWNRARERTTQLPQRDRTRRPHRRGARPTAAVIDARSVKASANVTETSQGIDAGKKTEGRGRHVISDTLGLVLAVLVTAASVHDTTGGKLLLDDLAAAHPSCRRSGRMAAARAVSSTAAPAWASMWRWCSGHGRRGSNRCRDGG
ncbi:hypothetical protein SGRIM128S_09609 [Streptomyces griseomycini]|nr:hypothetical protein GCM10015536_60000 [Streptomyces griseomycini]